MIENDINMIKWKTGDEMQFNPEKYTDEVLAIGEQTLHFRAYRNIPYVNNPVAPDLQVLNIFIPLAYIEGNVIGNYSAKTAPIFFPNSIGGYMESKPCSPAVREEYAWNTEAEALLHGYVVISAGARGKNTRNGEKYIGKAPACIVDQKAAIRFIRSIAEMIFGDVNRIISNGTSAGGAVSALLGATGDAEEYLPYLKELGAAEESDCIFASSCYCPITNLDHSDMAYEWQFGHLSELHYNDWSDGKPIPKLALLEARQKELSQKVAKQFLPYLKTIGISEQELLSLIEDCLLREAEKAAAKGIYIPPVSGISQDFKSVNLKEYSTFITRMKPPCCFDNPDWNTWENELFGSEEINGCHFTEFSTNEDEKTGETAPAETVAMMNPMNFLGNDSCVKHWRIRHGAADRDTSFAISAILTMKLREHGCKVDYALPWGTPHSGDYDLGELFAWIDDICDHNILNNKRLTHK